MNYSLLYQKTYEYLLEKAAKHNVTEAELKELYFKPSPAEFLQDVAPNDLGGVFYRMAFHLQNATMKSNIIDFKANHKIIGEVLLNFDYNALLDKYADEKSLYKALSEKIPKIKYDDINFEKNVGYKYAKSLYASAKFLRKYNSFDELLECFSNMEAMLPLFLHYEIYGFGIALACDFVKELNTNFDFAKPDIHIREIVFSLGFLDKISSGTRADYHTMVCMKDIATQISKSTEQQISTYMLDKIWWLICTETFYHHDNKKNSSDIKRKAYLEYIKNYI